MDNLSWEQLENKIYELNRIVSIKLMQEKDLKEQSKIGKVNKLLGLAIDECRK